MDGSIVRLEERRGSRRALDARSELVAALRAGADPDALAGTLGATLDVEARLVPAAEGEPGDVAIDAPGEPLAHLRLPGGVSPAARRAVEGSLGVLALALAGERRHARALAEDPPELLDRIVALAAIRPATARRIGGFAGLALHRPSAVACIAIGDPRAADGVRSALAGALVCDEGETLLVAAPARNPERLARTVASALAGTGTTPTVGITADPAPVEHLAAAIAEARRAVRAAPLVGRGGEVVTLGELGLRGALATADPELRAAARRLLAPIADYDAAHGRDLVRTLAVYLDEQGKPAATARRLYLHLNSLYYRLQRIEELLALTLDDPDNRFRLELALRLTAADVSSPAGDRGGR